jgi:metallo-beta-lactamase family protein
MAQAPILRFLGGVRTVTGSKFLVETDGARVLVDCGLFQGPKELRLRNWARFPVDPSSIDAVVLTHAHLDHCGYLPALVRDGFDGPIVCTDRTEELTRIVLMDSARLQEEEAGYANRKGFSKHKPALALYTQDDAARAIEQLRAIDFRRDAEVADGVHAVLRPAGHILGSATVTLTIDDPARTLFFSGDVGRPAHPVLQPPDPVPAADIVVTESTYGNREHEDPADAIERLATAISRTAERGGMVVIPAFAVDRTEVVLMELRRLIDDGRIPKLPIYCDSPMALAVLDVYRDAIDAGDVDVDPIEGEPFETGNGLHEAQTPIDSRKLNDLKYPSVIISSSGMATGGRVLHHLARRLPDQRNTVVLVGFQAVGTRGRQLAEGARSVKLLGRYVPVRADVVEIGAFSVHAGGGELVDWLRTAPTPPDAAFVVHGEESASEELRSRLESELGWVAAVPKLDERIRVD